MAKFLRKRAVAERYGNIHIRTVNRMVDEGRLPPPTIRGNRLCLWDEEALDEFDRKTARSTKRAADAGEAA